MRTTIIISTIILALSTCPSFARSRPGRTIRPAAGSQPTGSAPTARTATITAAPSRDELRTLTETMNLVTIRKTGRIDPKIQRMLNEVEPPSTEPAPQATSSLEDAYRAGVRLNRANRLRVHHGHNAPSTWAALDAVLMTYYNTFTPVTDSEPGDFTINSRLRESATASHQDFCFALFRALPAGRRNYLLEVNVDLEPSELRIRVGGTPIPTDRLLRVGDTNRYQALISVEPSSGGRETVVLSHNDARDGSGWFRFREVSLRLID